ncbi:MAG: oxidoreductase, partial [Gammaproteobacteria bacterium]|nr:oxidoreductase [Gammaproteobacteria bacterium]
KNLHLMTRCFVAGSVAMDAGGVEECVADAEVLLKKDGREVGRARTDVFGEWKIDRLDPDSGAYEIEIAAQAGHFETRFDLGSKSLNLGVMKLS